MAVVNPSLSLLPEQRGAHRFSRQRGVALGRGPKGALKELGL